MRGGRLRRYHETTKHSLESVRASAHWLDWENQPRPYRVYTGRDGERLALDGRPSGVPVLDALRSPPAARAGMPDRAALARLLHFSLGILHRRELPGGREIDFRAAPCTGALYHVDAWVVCGDLPDLEAGVHHFDPRSLALTRLRTGDWRPALVDAAGGEPHLARAPAVVVLASTWWRNAWKYRSRAYRHVFWDTGTILAQLLVQAAADRWPAYLVTAFADRVVERLCGLDPSREGGSALVAIGAAPTPVGVPAAPAAIDPLDAPTEPLSPREIDDAVIAGAHDASSLADGEAVRAWRAAAPPRGRGEVSGDLVRLPSPPPPGTESLERVIGRRGSARAFTREPITAEALSSLLAAVEAPLGADYRVDARAPLVDHFLVVNGVDGVEPGLYRRAMAANGLVPIAKGDVRREAGYLGLGQDLAADAAVNLYAIADLDLVLGALGDRGYRAAQLDGAIGGGRAYLGAYAQGLGATGLTFFDDDVARFFGLDPHRFGVMFLTAVGRARRS